MARHRWALVIGALAVVAAFSLGQAVGSRRLPANLKEGLVARTREAPETVDKLLKALAPAVGEQILAGRQVELPGLGSFRVVRIESYKDLDGGRPITIPARNYVEFVPTEELDGVSNQPGAVPARTVSPMEFRVNPWATPGMKTESIKTIRTRR
jgi:nucleoid DNA-binding protein